MIDLFLQLAAMGVFLLVYSYYGIFIAAKVTAIVALFCMFLSYLVYSKASSAQNTPSISTPEQKTGYFILNKTSITDNAIPNNIIKNISKRSRDTKFKAAISLLLNLTIAAYTGLTALTGNTQYINFSIDLLERFNY